VVRIEETPLGNNVYIEPSGAATTPSIVAEPGVQPFQP
jgi:hypothetical protein